MSEVVAVDKDVAKALFDIATFSMDFNSGFLDHDDVEMLRAFAVLIGVDPIDATPHDWRKQYKHTYKEQTYPNHPDLKPNCGRCDGSPEAAQHDIP